MQGYQDQAQRNPPRGRPDNIRSDNGTEFVAEAAKEYSGEQNIETRYVELGAPWENGYVEAFKSRFRDELLDRELFATSIEAQVLCEQWRRFYNEERLHRSLDYQTPAAFTANYETTEITPNQVPILTQGVLQLKGEPQHG